MKTNLEHAMKHKATDVVDAWLHIHSAIPSYSMGR